MAKAAMLLLGHAAAIACQKESKHEGLNSARQTGCCRWLFGASIAGALDARKLLSKMDGKARIVVRCLSRTEDTRRGVCAGLGYRPGTTPVVVGIFVMTMGSPSIPIATRSRSVRGDM